MDSIQLEKEKTLALKSMIMKQYQLKRENARYDHQIKNKWPEDQTDFTKKLYMLHQPIFLLALSLIVIYLIHTFLLDQLNIADSPLTGINEMPNAIKGVYMVILYVVVGLPPLMQVYFIKRTTKYTIKKYQLDLIGYAIMVFILVLTAYAFLMMVSFIGIPLANFIYQSELNAFNLLNDTIKYVAIHGLIYMFGVYILSFPFGLLIKLLLYIHPFFIIPFLKSKSKVPEFKKNLETNLKTIDQLDKDIKASDILDEADKGIGTLNAILEYFEDKRIDTARLGAIVYKNERDFLSWSSEQYQEAKSIANKNISEIDQTIQRNQALLDKDLDRRARIIYEAKKTLDEAEEKIRN